MPNYIPESIHKFHNNAPDNPQDAPHRWAKPTYVHATQYENPEDTSSLLPQK